MSGPTLDGTDIVDRLTIEAGQITCYASTTTEHPPNATAVLLREAATEILRLREYEWMYKDLCK
jgi:hypothetical protein